MFVITFVKLFAKIVFITSEITMKGALSLQKLLPLGGVGE